MAGHTTSWGYLSQVDIPFSEIVGPAEVVGQAFSLRTGFPAGPAGRKAGLRAPLPALHKHSPSIHWWSLEGGYAAPLLVPQDLHGLEACGPDGRLERRQDR